MRDMVYLEEHMHVVNAQVQPVQKEAGQEIHEIFQAPWTASAKTAAAADGSSGGRDIGCSDASASHTLLLGHPRGELGKFCGCQVCLLCRMVAMQGSCFLPLQIQINNLFFRGGK